jgi:integrase/recombinase XerD
MSMSALRRRMIEDMELAGLAPRTQETYLLAVSLLARYHVRSPDRLASEDLRDYFLHLLGERGLAPSTVSIYRSGIKFFYGRTLGRETPILDRIEPRKERKLPVVLSQDEVRRVLDRVRSQVCRTSLTVIYSCGLRVSEALALAASDVDRAHGRVHVRRGKGGDDRFVPLPQRTYQILRRYWHETRPSGDVLFPGRIPGASISLSAVQRSFRAARIQAGIRKPASVHSLRHSYATHLLDRGVSLRMIQRCLGHRSLKSTARYTHLSASAEQALRTVLDDLMADL